MANLDRVVGDLFEQRAGRLVQACTTLADPATRTREVVALTEAMVETGVRQAEIVALHEEETIDTDAGPIRVVPAWRWLLEGSSRAAGGGTDEKRAATVASLLRRSRRSRSARGGHRWSRNELHER